MESADEWASAVEEQTDTESVASFTYDHGPRKPTLEALGVVSAATSAFSGKSSVEDYRDVSQQDPTVVLRRTREGEPRDNSCTSSPAFSIGAWSVGEDEPSKGRPKYRTDLGYRPASEMASISSQDDEVDESSVGRDCEVVLRRPARPRTNHRFSSQGVPLTSSKIGFIQQSASTYHHRHSGHWGEASHDQRNIGGSLKRESSEKREDFSTPRRPNSVYGTATGGGVSYNNQPALFNCGTSFGSNQSPSDSTSRRRHLVVPHSKRLISNHSFSNDRDFISSSSGTSSARPTTMRAASFNVGDTNITNEDVVYRQRPRLTPQNSFSSNGSSGGGSIRDDKFVEQFCARRGSGVCSGNASGSSEDDDDEGGILGLSNTWGGVGGEVVLRRSRRFSGRATLVEKRASASLEGQIRELKDERESVQKKTFMKWVNSHLIRVNSRIGDLYLDLRDGKQLIKLLEILSGERLPRPTKGNMRIHCLENVDKALQFLRDQRVHLENMGSHDIVDGNACLTLGLIWTIILRFQIQDITIEESEDKETKSAKDALLLWCQMKTAGYHNVNIRNFTTSWRDGLAFNAIIHKHRADLVNYEKLTRSNAMGNLNNAFNVAESKLGITKLLDAEDVFVELPDEKSIITYVVTYYHYFSKMKQETVQGKRIGKVVGIAMENDRMVHEYETLTSELLKWIEMTIESLNDRQFINSLIGVQQQLGQFNAYRTIEKPPKFVEKGNLEVLLFTLQSRMRANNQRPYLPKEGRLISDINKAWEMLEKSEHGRELALREELIRQEKLEQLAARFDRKAGMRETWLSENQRLVSQDNFGFDLAAVEAAAKKHEAIETDIFAYEERVQAVVGVAKELEAENYHDVARINARRDNVLKLWNYLLELLRLRRMRLELSLQLQQNFQEMLYILDSMEEMKSRLLSEDYGKHLMGVQDLLQKHSLLEADINVLGERVKTVMEHSQRFLDIGDSADGEEPPYRACEPQLVLERVQQLEDAYAELVKLAVERRARLEESRQLWQFYWDMAEEENYIKEKENILSSSDIGHDLNTVNMLLTKHKTVEEELNSHEVQLKAVIDSGEGLIRSQHFGSDKIRERIDEILAMWNLLRQKSAARQGRLTDGVALHQLLSEADDVDTWMLDVLRLVSSEDVGSDEATVQSLLKKHKAVTDEVKEYATNIEVLHQQAGNLHEDDRTSSAVVDRLGSIDRRYQELLELARERKQRLLDALSLYKLATEAAGVEQWVGEKERMLETMVPARDIEDCEVMKHRYQGFDQEMNANAGRVAVVNQLARQLLHVDHPNSEDIIQTQNQLNQRWAQLREKAEGKREELNAAHGVQTFHIECRETVLWIEDKKRVLLETADLGTDLSGIMTLQRRLSGMERDLAAIQAKLDALEREADKISSEHPEEADLIRQRVSQIREVWDQLTQLLKERDAKLEEAGDLHRFLRDLDHFQAWLTKTMTDVASEDIPSNLTEAEKLLNQHQSIREEIDNYTEDYTKMMQYGERITAEDVTPADDAQYMFLRERLKALKDGWAELHQMWENRQQLLSDSLNLQMFLRDAKQGEVVLNQQEHYLSKDETPSNLEQAENTIKRHEAFLTTMEANEEKLNAICQFGNKLIEDNHFAGDKIQKKAENIEERRAANRDRAMQLMDRLRDQLQVHQFLQDCEELNDWVQEKHIIAQDESYRSAKTVHSKWTRHQAFEAEIASNKDRLVRVQQAGQELMKEKPEMVELIGPKIDELSQHFDALETTTSEKGGRLFDANRKVLYEQSCDDIDSWMADLEKQIEKDTGGDLTSVNILMQKQQMIETQMAVKAKQVEQLEGQAEYLQQMTPEKADEIKQMKAKVELKFESLKAPLMSRQQELAKKKEAFQFRRDIEDEKLWIAEKMPLATSTEYGNSLFTVHTLNKKLQSLTTEVDNHEPRINLVSSNGLKLIDEGHVDADEFRRLVEELQEDWAKLKEALDHRRQKLLVSEKAQQYLFDAGEAEVWMSEQELYMMVEDRGKDEISAQNLMKKHQGLEGAVDDYAETIRQLGETARHLINEGHPESEQIAIRQSQIDKLYAGLRDLAVERRSRLDEALKLFMLSREVDDLEQWIAEREVVAGSHELGQDYDHVMMLRERFREFARATESAGVERVAAVNEIADQLIAAGHSDAATIATWKDVLNESWADLLELIDTRTQMLSASWELHKFFHDCKDALSRIVEKQHSISDELGRDAGSVSALQRKHQNFVQDLVMLHNQVQQIQEDSGKLQAAYAGDKAREITSREAEVVSAWLSLQGLCEDRRVKLSDTGDLFKFFCLVRTLMLWMDDVVRQMNTTEKARDVSGVELLMNNHQSLKAEVDAREDNFSACVMLGKELLSRGHYASPEIKDKLMALSNGRNNMLQRWELRWEHLQLILEVYQFARDASVAEQWLLAQEPYLISADLGRSIDQVENLIKRHEAFEKACNSQEERFAALERLTTLEKNKSTDESPSFGAGPTIGEQQDLISSESIENLLKIIDREEQKLHQQRQQLDQRLSPEHIERDQIRTSNDTESRPEIKFSDVMTVSAKDDSMNRLSVKDIAFGSKGSCFERRRQKEHSQIPVLSLEAASSPELSPASTLRSPSSLSPHLSSRALPTSSNSDSPSFPSVSPSPLPTPFFDSPTGSEKGGVSRTHSAHQETLLFHPSASASKLISSKLLVRGSTNKIRAVGPKYCLPELRRYASLPITFSPDGCEKAMPEGRGSGGGKGEATFGCGRLSPLYPYDLAEFLPPRNSRVAPQLQHMSLAMCQLLKMRRRHQRLQSWSDPNLEDVDGASFTCSVGDQGDAVTQGLFADMRGQKNSAAENQQGSHFLKSYHQNIPRRCFKGGSSRKFPHLSAFNHTSVQDLHACPNLDSSRFGMRNLALLQVSEKRRPVSCPPNAFEEMFDSSSEYTLDSMGVILSSPNNSDVRYDLTNSRESGLAPSPMVPRLPSLVVETLDQLHEQKDQSNDWVIGDAGDGSQFVVRPIIAGIDLKCSQWAVTGNNGLSIRPISGGIDLESPYCDFEPEDDRDENCALTGIAEVPLRRAIRDPLADELHKKLQTLQNNSFNVDWSNDGREFREVDGDGECFLRKHKPYSYPDENPDDADREFQHSVLEFSSCLTPDETRARARSLRSSFYGEDSLTLPPIYEMEAEPSGTMPTQLTTPPKSVEFWSVETLDKIEFSTLERRKAFAEQNHGHAALDEEDFEDTGDACLEENSKEQFTSPIASDSVCTRSLTGRGLVTGNDGTVKKSHFLSTSNPNPDCKGLYMSDRDAIMSYYPLKQERDEALPPCVGVPPSSSINIGGQDRALQYATEVVEEDKRKRRSMPLTPLLGSIEEEDGKKSTSSPSSPVDIVEEEMIRRRNSAPDSRAETVAVERRKRRSLGSAIKNAILRTPKSPDTSRSLSDASGPSVTNSAALNYEDRRHPIAEGDDVGTHTHDSIKNGNRLGEVKTAINKTGVAGKEFELKELKRRQEEEEAERLRREEEAKQAEIQLQQQQQQMRQSPQDTTDRGEGGDDSFASGDKHSDTQEEQHGSTTTPRSGSAATPATTPSSTLGRRAGGASVESSPSPGKASQSASSPGGGSATLPLTSPGRGTPRSAKVQRSRSKSPFRSFRWKKGAKASSPSVASLHSNEDDDEERFTAPKAAPTSIPVSSAYASSAGPPTAPPQKTERSSPGEEDVLEGSLVRKHEWEATTKKASNRSWDKVFVVVRGSTLMFYKDSKTYKASPDQYFRGEAPIDLLDSQATIAEDYTKKKNVFRLKLANGGEYLFQARDEEELVGWSEGLQAAAQGGMGGAAGGRSSQTLPAGSEKRDEPKRRSFFTLKKK